MFGSPRYEFGPYQFSIKKIGSRDKLASPLYPTPGRLYRVWRPFPAGLHSRAGFPVSYRCFHQRSMSWAGDQEGGALAPTSEGEPEVSPSVAATRSGAADICPRTPAGRCPDPPRNLRFLGFSLCLRRAGLRALHCAGRCPDLLKGLSPLRIPFCCRAFIQGWSAQRRYSAAAVSLG